MGYRQVYLCTVPVKVTSHVYVVITQLINP